MLSWMAQEKKITSQRQFEQTGSHEHGHYEQANHQAVVVEYEEYFQAPVGGRVCRVHRSTDSALKWAKAMV